MHRESLRHCLHVDGQNDLLLLDQRRSDPKIFLGTWNPGHPVPTNTKLLKSTSSTLVSIACSILAISRLLDAAAGPFLHRWLHHLPGRLPPFSLASTSCWFRGKTRSAFTSVFAFSVLEEQNGIAGTFLSWSWNS